MIELGGTVRKFRPQRFLEQGNDYLASSAILVSIFLNFPTFSYPLLGGSAVSAGFSAVG
jgi:hypothetical protein